MATRTFGYTPDGTSPLLERLSWSTDVLTAMDGTEHRKCLRSRPLYRYEYTLAASAQHSNGYSGLLADLRNWQQDWLVPLWPHAVSSPFVPSSGLDSAGNILAFDAAGVASAGNLLAVPPLAAIVVPSGLGRIVESRKLSHVVDFLATAQVAFELYNHSEVVPAYDHFDDGVAVFDFPTDWSTAIVEDISADENRVDYGGLWVAETRFSTRTVSVPVYLDSAAAIARFRSFVFHAQGCFRAFKGTAGADPSQALWRLNSDAVEILHINPTLATSALTFKQL